MNLHQSTNPQQEQEELIKVKDPQFLMIKKSLLITETFGFGAFLDLNIA